MSLNDELRMKNEKWGLVEDPFPDVPPRDPEKVAKFFVGRSEETATALSTLYRGDNLFIRGTWGIGKTAFIFNTMYKLMQESEGYGKIILPIYIYGFQGGSAEEFFQVIFNALTKTINRYFPDKLNKIISSIHPNELTANIYFIQATWQKNAAETTSIAEKIEECLGISENKRCQLVIAVDDLDKSTIQQGEINDMLKDSLHILRDRRCSFLITSRTLARFDDLENSQLGIADTTIPLTPLDKDELKEAIIRQLNIVRTNPRNDAFPFSDSVVDEIARKSFGIPRVLNRICKKTLDIAARNKHAEINDDQFAVCFKFIQNDLSIQIPPDIKVILYYAIVAGGFHISSKEQTFEKVLSELGLSTVYDLLPYLDKLTQSDYMVKVERPEGISYQVAPGLEQSALEGKEALGKYKLKNQI